MDISHRSNSSLLLLLLDGVLSQNEQNMNLVLNQIFQALDPTLKDVISKSPLQSASTLEHIVRRILLLRPQLAKVLSETDGSAPLHFAASIGNVNIACCLLEHYPVSALIQNKKGKIPLHYAAREGRLDMVYFLLQRVPQSASAMTHKFKLPIHFAASEGHIEVVRALLKTNPLGASTPTKKGKVALHFAARWGHLEIARDLYRLCPQSVEMLDYDGSLPLHEAVREGQIEMAKFLVERYPQGTSKENIRGELPLFGAVRSGNVELCSYLIRSWPQSGKLVLQEVRAEDDVASWDPMVLELCLRGGVNNLSELQHDPNQSNPSTASPPILSNKLLTTGTREQSVSCNCVGRPKALTAQDRFDSGGSIASQEVASIFAAHSISTVSSVHDPFMDRLTPGLDIALPRFNSPVLKDGFLGIKRSASKGTNDNKRSRRTGSEDQSDTTSKKESNYNLAVQTFYHLHAALHCNVATQVLETILDRHGKDQLMVVDDYGKLPLHIALENNLSEDAISLILKRIWEPYRQSSFSRDYLGRLPLHIALMSRADCRLIEALLKENPSSGVDHCDAVDPRLGEKLPIHVATEYGCDLSTIFLLLKGDPTAVQTWNGDADRI